jgi:hypothetical protein
LKSANWRRKGGYSISVLEGAEARLTICSSFSLAEWIPRALTECLDFFGESTNGNRATTNSGLLHPRKETMKYSDYRLIAKDFYNCNRLKRIRPYPLQVD